MRSPLEVTETHWLRSRDVSDAPAVAGEGYYDRHDVPRPAETTAADLPPADSEAVRELDREAIERGKLVGKWQVTGSAERVEALWPALVADAEAGTLWAVKAMTPYGYERLPMYDAYVLAVYMPNYLATADVDRVRAHLRTAHGVTDELRYKPDLYTAKGIDRDTAGEFGLSTRAVRRVATGAPRRR